MTGRRQPGEGDKAGAEPQRGLLRGRHREVLRDHLADDEVEEDDDGERDGVPERMDDLFGDVGRLEDGLQEMRDGRFGDRAERQRADGDAELGGRHHLRQMFEAVEDLAGPLGVQRLDLAAAYGDERELGPHEEAVREHQEQGEQELEHAHRTASATCACGVPLMSAVRTRRTRSAR